MNLAVIPARGGSKRIPGKNIKSFHGLPLISYSITKAIESGCFDKVIVSTDDENIAKIARDYGAETPFLRPKSISNDFASTLDVMKHAVDYYSDKGDAIDLVCCIYATAPMLSAVDLRKGMEVMKQDGVLYAFSATSYPYPIQRALKLGSDGTIKMFSPEFENTRSQDLEEAYHDAGQFYWGKVQAFREKAPIFAQHSKMVQIERSRVQDIDTLEDWEVAEAMFLAQQS